MKQRDFFAKTSEFSPGRISHGGGIVGRKRKLSRPLDSRKPVHLVLKSTTATGARSFLFPANDLFIERTLAKYARAFRVSIQRFENMGNHLHLIAKFRRREDFQNFLRTVTALIARFITKARRGHPFGKRFWDALAFTRVITGRRDYFGVVDYLDKNHCEREYGPEARRTIEADEREIRKKRRRSSNRNATDVG